MKTPYLTFQKIQQAVKFLQNRKTHARMIKNKEWENEFDNAITVCKYRRRSPKCLRAFTWADKAV